MQLPDAGASQLLQGVGTLRRPGRIDGPAAGDGDLQALSGPVQVYLRTCFRLYSIKQSGATTLQAFLRFFSK